MKIPLEGISHRPLGAQHPYDQDPDERFPREPRAGEAVTLGVITRPLGAANRVWATVAVDDHPPVDYEGTFLQDQGEVSVWRVELLVFGAGARVVYRLHASDGATTLQTPIYEFRVLDWVRGTRITAYGIHGSAAFVELGTDGTPAEATLLLNLVSDTQVRLSLSLGEDRALALPSDSSWFWHVASMENGLVLSSARLVVRLQQEPFCLEIRRESGEVLLKQEAPPEWLVAPGTGPRRARWTFSSAAGEGFYGFGERYNSFDQRGFTLDTRVYEQYKHQGRRTYFPVPFFLSSQGYALHVRTNRNVVFDLADSRRDCWSFDAELGSDRSLSLDLFTAETPAANVTAFVRSVGLPKMPPEWAFRPWMSSNEWNSQETVMEQVRTTLEMDVPAGVVVIEAWSDETTFYIWNDAVYRPKPGAEGFHYRDFSFPKDGHWPDPKGMVDDLHRLGLRVILWQIPVMKKIDQPHAQRDADEQTMLSENFCVRHTDGTLYRVKPGWFRGSLLLDFTNAEAAEWWLKKRAYLLEEIGIDGFKTDGGEHLWATDVVLANGLSGDEAVNLYPNLYVGAYHDLTSRLRGGDALTFSRAGYTGAQAYPCHWAGDQDSTWEAYRATLLAGLNVGLCGVPFWGWDMAGFSGEIPSAELYLRAAATALFTPIMQYHSEFNEHRTPSIDRTPWNIAARTGRPEVIDIYRRLAKLRVRLLPYIVAEARHSSASGEPLLRPLFLDWPEDPAVWRIGDQYSFGRGLLVAPVLEPGVSERNVYLPAGHWRDFWTGGHVDGGRWVTAPCPLDRIPVYAREAYLQPELLQVPLE